MGCLIISLIISGAAEAGQETGHVWNCEFEVTNDGDDGMDPCIIINRVGYKKNDKWEVLGDTTECEGYQDDLADINSDKMYFECNDQERVSVCTPDFIASGIGEDSDRCKVGTYDGYVTSMILIQMEYVVTPMLHNHGKHVDSITTHPDTVISKTIVHELDFDRRIIYSDARAFTDGFDDHEDCIGYQCDKDAHSDSGTEWMDFLVADGDDAPDSEVLIASEFDDDRDAVILDVKSSDLMGKNAGTVPITVEGISDGAFAMSVSGVEAGSDDSSNIPQIEIRGWNVELKSGSGLMKTENTVDAVFSRSIVQVLPGAGGAFQFSSDTIADFSRGLTIDMKGSTVAPIVFKGDPSSEALYALTDGLTITYSTNPDLVDISPPLLVEDSSGVEKAVECVLGSDECDAYLSGVGKFIAFEMLPGEYKITQEPYPLVPFAKPVFLYAAEGDDIGTRIVLVEEEIVPEEDNAEAEDDVGDDEDDDDDDFEDKTDDVDNDSDDEDGASHDCPEGKYWSNHFAMCISPGGSGKNNSTGGSDDVDSDDDDSGTSGASYGQGTPSDGDGAIDEETAPEEGAGLSPVTYSDGGCSMMASGTSNNVIHIIFPLLSLLVFAIRRKL